MFEEVLYSVREDNGMGTLGERIAEARKGKGWSQGELARQLGTTAAAVSRWETNDRVPRGVYMYAISTATGVNHRWLAIGEGDKYGEAEDIRSVEDERIIKGLSPKEKETVLRFLNLGRFDRKNIRTKVNGWLDKIEQRLKEEGH